MTEEDVPSHAGKTSSVAYHPRGYRTKDVALNSALKAARKALCDSQNDRVWRPKSGLLRHTATHTSLLRQDTLLADALNPVLDEFKEVEPLLLVRQVSLGSHIGLIYFRNQAAAIRRDAAELAIFKDSGDQQSLNLALQAFRLFDMPVAEEQDDSTDDSVDPTDYISIANRYLKFKGPDAWQSLVKMLTLDWLVVCITKTPRDTAFPGHELRDKPYMRLPVAKKLTEVPYFTVSTRI